MTATPAQTWTLTIPRAQAELLGVGSTVFFRDRALVITEIETSQASSQAHVDVRNPTPAEFERLPRPTRRRHLKALQRDDRWRPVG